MNCRFPRTQLALHVEGDLPEREARDASDHLRSCAECGRFFEELQGRQDLVKSLRLDSPHPVALSNLRRDVLARIAAPEHRLGWRVSLERLLFFGFRGCFRGPRFAAVACLALFAIVSISVLARMRRPEPNGPVAIRGEFSLPRPEGYRNWRRMEPVRGSRQDLAAHAASASSQRIFVSPEAYREYADTGKFPEGAVFILESSKADRVVALQASVQDSTKFEGGWGFFDFAVKEGRIAPFAEAVHDAEICRTCHEERGETDHV